MLTEIVINREATLITRGNSSDHCNSFYLPDAVFSGTSSNFLNSTSEPSACNATCPLDAVQLKPEFTRSPFSQTLMVLPAHSMIMVFHWPGAFSELPVRLSMRRFLP